MGENTTSIHHNGHNAASAIKAVGLLSQNEGRFYDNQFTLCRICGKFRAKRTRFNLSMFICEVCGHRFKSRLVVPTMTKGVGKKQQRFNNRSTSKIMRNMKAQLKGKRGNITESE